MRLALGLLVMAAALAWPAAVGAYPAQTDPLQAEDVLYVLSGIKCWDLTGGGQLVRVPCRSAPPIPTGPNGKRLADCTLEADDGVGPGATLICWWTE
jgi:hypothetical protein